MQYPLSDSDSRRRGVGEKAALNAALLTAALHNSFQIFPATPRARGGD